MSPVLKVRFGKCGIMWNRADSEQSRSLAALGMTLRELRDSWMQKEKCRGASLRGQGTPALFLHASAVSEQENRNGF